MSTIVDHVFPPTDVHSSPSMAMNYSSFTFWREPLPKISDDVPEEDMKNTEEILDSSKEVPDPNNANSSKEASEKSESSSPATSTSSQTTVVETLDENLH